MPAMDDPCSEPLLDQPGGDVRGTRKIDGDLPTSSSSAAMMADAGDPTIPTVPPPPSYQDYVVDTVVDVAADVKAAKLGESPYAGKLKRNAVEAGFDGAAVGGDREEGGDVAEKRFVKRPTLPAFESVDAVDFQMIRGSKRPLEDDNDATTELPERDAKRFRPTLPSLDSTSLVDTLLKGQSSSSLIDTSIEAVFKALGIDLTSNVLTPPGSGFPRFRQSTTFNLFGIQGLEVALCTLDRDDARLFELFYRQKATFYALELQHDVSLGHLSSWLKDTVLGAVLLKDASVVYQVSTESNWPESQLITIRRQSCPVDLNLPLGLNISATITVDDTSPELNSVLKTLCGVTNPQLTLKFHTPELPNWSSPLTFGQFAIDASIPDLAVSLIDDHVVLTSLAIRLHGHMATRPSESHAVIMERVYDWQLLGSMDITLRGLPTRELDFSLSKYESRWKLDVVLDVDWEDAFGIKGLVVSLQSESLEKRRQRQGRFFSFRSV